MTIKKTTFWFALLAVLVLHQTAFAQTQIEFNNTSVPCPRNSVVACTTPDNRASFTVTTQNPDPPKPGSRAIPRFKAFWITGDGNYLEFPNSLDDAESRAPTIPYKYERPGDYNMSVYLTGKYTDRNPPPGAARQISVGSQPTTRPPGTSASDFEPTSFQQRVGTGDFDFFPIHELRKNYLIPFVLSYPATIDSSWGYLFYNGRARMGGAWNTPTPLKYQKTTGEVAKYYDGTAADIASFPAASLSTPGSVGGFNFLPAFAGMGGFYADFVYFPLETAAVSALPTGFSKKRYFPVFWADSSSRIILNENDSLMSFFYIVTAPRPLPQNDQDKVNSTLNALNLGLSASNPINTNDQIVFDRVGKSQVFAQSAGPNPPLQYIQGVYSSEVSYVAAHDPNQLTITKIEAIGGGKFRVTFYLEMCNKGAGDTHSQTIDLFDKFGRFSEFVRDGNPVVMSATTPRHYIMTSNLPITGIPEGEYEMMCDGFEFTATTNCDGIRSLWDTNPETAFEVCVKFNEGFSTECGPNFPIDSCDFKVENACPCVEKQTCGGGILMFVLIIVFLLLLWKLITGSANNNQ